MRYQKVTGQPEAGRSRGRRNTGQCPPSGSGLGWQDRPSNTSVIIGALTLRRLSAPALFPDLRSETGEDLPLAARPVAIVQYAGGSINSPVRARTRARPQPRSPKVSRTMPGARSMSARSTRAGPLGCLRPCSHCRRVPTDTPIARANSACVQRRHPRRGIRARIAATSSREGTSGGEMVFWCTVRFSKQEVSVTIES
jgi:hypothetical protein